MVGVLPLEGHGLRPERGGPRPRLTPVAQKPLGLLVQGRDEQQLEAELMIKRRIVHGGASTY
ncbi:hypothetical protein Skr01_42900 [Sphaerisporangium krabiense]|nr:hypothetical protein Skr01_42900 [Sphaerisporangium krabiense]